MITAVFDNKGPVLFVHGLWQYDYGQTLRIQGLQLPPAVEIHFSLEESGGTSTTRVGVTKDGVTDVVIPDAMLENGGIDRNYKIYAFIYLADAESGQTVKKISIHVKSRPRPEAFDTPEDAELFREAIQAVNESAESARGAVVAAESWANQARETVKEIPGYVGDAKKEIDAYVMEKANELKGEPGTDANVTLENIKIPEYWKAAVDNMRDSILAQLDEGGRNAFGFVWGADIHGINGYTNPSNGAGTSVTKNIGYVAQYATALYDLPFVLFSGDIMSQASHPAEETVHIEHENMWKLFSPIDKEKILLGKGNHDGAYGAAVDGVYYLYNIGGKEVYNNLFRRQALDRTRVFGGDGSYFYIDTSNNMRVIMLNAHTDGDGSVDENGYAVYNSMKHSIYGTEQLDWLVNVALANTDGKRIILSAHPPLSQSSDGKNVIGILNAYNNRTTFSNSVNLSSGTWGNGLESEYNTSSVTVDFTNATGKVVAYFHGHIHKDTIDNTSYTFISASITTAGADVRDTNPPARTAGTATETALDVVIITDKKIYFNRLGAGSDRVISLDGTVEYSIKNNLANAKSSNNVINIVAGNLYSATISANTGYELETVKVTMGGVDVTSFVYSNGVITISEVTGNIVITASAVKIEANEPATLYTNVLPLAQYYDSTAPYVGSDGSVGYANNMRISTSSASKTYMKESEDVDVTALIPIKRGDVLRFKNCNFKVNPTNTTYGSAIQGYDSSKAVISGFNCRCDNLSIRLPAVVEDDECVQITIEPLELWTTSDVDSVAYIMISTDGLDETSIITINEEIIEGSTPNYTNLADPTSVDWKDGYRFASGGETTESGTTISNKVRVEKGDIVYFKGAALRENHDRYALGVKRSDTGEEAYLLSYFQKNMVSGDISMVEYVGLDDGVYKFNILNEYSGEIQYIRFAFPTPADTSDIIITVNEEII